MTFSIIIPVYNTAKYLANCIENVLNQSYQNYEIILVDDGSTDGSEKLCDEYAEKDRRIQVIHKQNGGISSARNKGIECSKGEYLLFLDSDDHWGDSKALEKIKNASQNKTRAIIVFEFYSYVEGATTYCLKTNNLQYIDKNRAYSGQEYLNCVLSEEENYEWFPWIYAYRRSLWDNFRFDQSIRYFEDAELIYKIILSAEKIAVLKNPIYFYRTKREGSLTSTSVKLLNTIVCVAERNINTVNDMKIEKKLSMLLNDNFAHFYYMVMILLNFLKAQEQEEILRILKKKKFIIKYTIKTQDKILRIMISVFGIKFTSKLLFLRAKIKEKKTLRWKQ